MSVFLWAIGIVGTVMVSLVALLLLWAWLTDDMD